MRGFGNWKTYQDIDPSIEAITGEDFINNDFITEHTEAVLSDDNIVFGEVVLPEKKGKLSAISALLKKKNTGMTDDQIRDTINKIKDSIFDNLKYRNIEHEEYLKLLKGISFS